METKDEIQERQALSEKELKQVNGGGGLCYMDENGCMGKKEDECKRDPYCRWVSNSLFNFFLSLFGLSSHRYCDVKI